MKHKCLILPALPIMVSFVFCIITGCNHGQSIIGGDKNEMGVDFNCEIESPLNLTFLFFLGDTVACTTKLEPGSRMGLYVHIGNDSQHDLFFRLTVPPFITFEYTRLDGSTVVPDTIGILDKWFLEKMYDPRGYQFLVGRSTTGRPHKIYRGDQIYQFATTEFTIPYRENIQSIRAQVDVPVRYVYLGTDNFQSLRLQATRDFDVKGFKSIELGGAVESGDEPVDDTNSDSEPDAVAGPEGKKTRD